MHQFIAPVINFVLPTPVTNLLFQCSIQSACIFAHVSKIVLSSSLPTLGHLVTKISDKRRRFEVILTSFSSHSNNGRLKLKLKLKLSVYSVVRQPTNQCAISKVFHHVNTFAARFESD